VLLLLPLAQQAVGDGLQEVADSQGDFFIVCRHPHTDVVDAQVMENGGGLAPERRARQPLAKDTSLSFLPALERSGSACTKTTFSQGNHQSVQGRVLLFIRIVIYNKVTPKNRDLPVMQQTLSNEDAKTSMAGLGRGPCARLLAASPRGARTPSRQ